MKKNLSKFIRFIFFLSIGACLFIWLYRDQNPTALLDLLKNDVNYTWIWLSLFLGLLSHLARAQRWRLLIEQAEKKTTWYNTAMAIFVAYLANLALPRMGEITRCAVLSRYEKISFPRLIGTVAAERLTDLVMLILVFTLAISIEFTLLWGFIKDRISGQHFPVWASMWIIALIFLTLITLLIFRRTIVNVGLYIKLKGLWAMFKDGFLSIYSLPNKGLYITISLFIWLMYFGMQYVSFFAFSATSGLSPSAGLVILVTGSIGMLAPVQGGIGPWHAMVIATMALYGVTQEPAYAFALLVHGVQNLLVIVLGLASLIIFPLINKHSSPKAQ